MRPPQEAWLACAEDPRWIEDPAAMVAEILREGFAAGFTAGAELGAATLEAHADALASNLSLRLPPAVARGVAGRATVLRETAADAATLDGAWADAIGQQRTRRAG